MVSDNKCEVCGIDDKREGFGNACGPGCAQVFGTPVGLVGLLTFVAVVIIIGLGLLLFAWRIYG